MSEWPQLTPDSKEKPLFTFVWDLWEIKTDAETQKQRATQNSNEIENSTKQEQKDYVAEIMKVLVQLLSLDSVLQIVLCDWWKEEGWEIFTSFPAEDLSVSPISHKYRKAETQRHVKIIKWYIVVLWNPTLEKL